jgi:hypothetical protein
VLLTLALGPSLALLGCGWTPLYSEAAGGPASEELRPTPERYRLRTTLVTALSNLGIESEGLASLGKLDVYATYYLIDNKSGRTLQVNTVHVANSFNLNPNQYSTVVGEDDAAVRSVAELNQEIVTRLALFMERRLAEQPPAPG